MGRAKKKEDLTPAAKADRDARNREAAAQKALESKERAAKKAADKKAKETAQKIELTKASMRQTDATASGIVVSPPNLPAIPMLA